MRLTRTAVAAVFTTVLVGFFAVWTLAFDRIDGRTGPVLFAGAVVLFVAMSRYER